MPGNFRKLADDAEPRRELLPARQAGQAAAPSAALGNGEQMPDFPSRAHEVKGAEASFRPAPCVSAPEAVHVRPEPRAAGAGSNWSRSSG